MKTILGFIFLFTVTISNQSFAGMKRANPPANLEDGSVYVDSGHMWIDEKCYGYSKYKDSKGHIVIRSQPDPVSGYNCVVGKDDPAVISETAEKPDDTKTDNKLEPEHDKDED